MGYDRGDSFPYDFELNGILFGSKSKGKLSPRSYPIQCERKCKYSFFIEHRRHLTILLPILNHYITPFTSLHYTIYMHL